MKNGKKVTGLLLILAFILSFTISSSAQVSGAQTQSQQVKHKLRVHFLDVGQADSILIQTPNGRTILIDAGNNNDSEFVINYIRSLKINRIDWVVGTHPHEDHIGGLDAVIKTFEIGNVLMPKVMTNTKTFLDVLTAVKRKGLIVTAPVAGSRIDVDDDIIVDVLAPNKSKYEDFNNYSAVLKLTYKNTAYLFQGDAEELSEKEILAKKFKVKADVLKVGHHGSSSSTSVSYLKAVAPKYAIISVGKGNSYGHPEKETINRLSAAKVHIYRTDEVGTIVSESDGKTITFNKKASPVKPQAPPSPKPGTNADIKPLPDKTETPIATTVYITKTGAKYHDSGCRYLSRSKIPIKLNDAKVKGYTACSVCNPPK